MQYQGMWPGKRQHTQRGEGHAREADETATVQRVHATVRPDMHMQYQKGYQWKYCRVKRREAEVGAKQAQEVPRRARRARRKQYARARQPPPRVSSPADT